MSVLIGRSESRCERVTLCPKAVKPCFEVEIVELIIIPSVNRPS